MMVRLLALNIKAMAVLMRYMSKETNEYEDVVSINCDTATLEDHRWSCDIEQENGITYNEEVDEVSADRAKNILNNDYYFDIEPLDGESWDCTVNSEHGFMTCRTSQ